MDSLNILVVDDSPIITRKLTMMLELLGYKVVKTAETGTLAFYGHARCLPRRGPADLHQPEMDGIEATKRIMQEFPEARIVMVTSHGQEKMVIDALKAGAKGYVLKPFDGQKLNEAIEKACKRVVLKDKLRAELTLRESDADAASATNAPAPSDAPSP